MKCDAALSVTYTGNTKEQLDNMLTALDSVIGVLILSAGMLAFVVLYNLNNININERKRELATIKVLGFYDKEVSAYVYRENILLTILGSIFGIFLGILFAPLYHCDRGSGCLYVRTEHQRVQLCDIRPDHLWIFHSGKRCDVFQTEKRSIW